MKKKITDWLVQLMRSMQMVYFRKYVSDYNHRNITIVYFIFSWNVTCAGHLLVQRLGWLDIHPCVHGKASTHNPQSGTLEADSVTERPLCKHQLQKKTSAKNLLTFSQLTSWHHWGHGPQCLHERGVYHQVTAGIGQVLNKKQAVRTKTLKEMEPVDCTEGRKPQLPGISLKKRWQEWGHHQPWPSRLQTSAWRQDGWSTSRPPLKHTCIFGINELKIRVRMRIEEPDGAKQPVESSCKPTSKASLSVSEREVVKQLKY